MNRQLHFVKTTSLDRGGEALAALKYSNALAFAGVRVTLFSRNVTEAYSEAFSSSLKFVHLPVAKNIFLDLWIIYRFVCRLFVIERPDLIHLHGLWSPFLSVVALVARFSKIPFVISPHGCLDPWALMNKRWKKQLALWLYQMSVLRSATMFMVTSESERRSVRILGLKQPVAIVPNGVDVPVEVVAHRKTDVRTFLFLSRLHPGKGLLDLVEAWAAVRQPGWHIVIAGGDEGGHQGEVENLIRQKRLQADFSWVGFVTGEAKQLCFEQADVFVLPTYSENFGIAIAEALANGLPVITTTGAPWPGLVTRGCGWWVEPGVAGIASALRQAMSCSPDELKEMGHRGRHWVANQYAWDKIGRDAALACRWLLDRSLPKPDCVDIGAS